MWVTNSVCSLLTCMDQTGAILIACMYAFLSHELVHTVWTSSWLTNIHLHLHLHLHLHIHIHIQVCMYAFCGVNEFVTQCERVRDSHICMHTYICVLQCEEVRDSHIYMRTCMRSTRLNTCGVCVSHELVHTESRTRSHIHVCVRQGWTHAYMYVCVLQCERVRDSVWTSLWLTHTPHAYMYAIVCGS